MKNAAVSGSVIGILSALWLFLINGLGYNTTNDHLAPITYLSFVILLAGIFIAVWRYKLKDKENQISFFEALVQSFKILFISGVIAGFFRYCLPELYTGKNKPTLFIRAFIRRFIGRGDYLFRGVAYLDESTV